MLYAETRQGLTIPDQCYYTTGSVLVNSCLGMEISGSTKVEQPLANGDERLLFASLPIIYDLCFPEIQTEPGRPFRWRATLALRGSCAAPFARPSRR